MSTITPVGVEKANRAKFFAGLGGSSEIGKRVVVLADESLPSGCSGTDIKWNFGFCESRSFFFKWMIRLVTPIESDAVLWQYADERRELQNEVTPEHHFPVARGNFTMNLLYEVKIDAAFAIGVA